MSVILITDLDNTLYNFVDYFGKSFRGMTHAVSKNMGIEESRFIAGARQVYKRERNLEYPFLIQNLPFIDQYTDEEIVDFVSLAKNVFSRVRKSNLKLYEGIEDTLRYLRSVGVVVIGVTNAPLNQAEVRLKQMGIDKYYYGLLGREDWTIPSNKHTELIQRNIKNNVYISKHIRKRWELPYESLKPKSVGYLTILNTLRVSHKNTYIIGDSLEKDIKPANEIGAISIWAKYGTQFEKENLETLIEITHWGDTEVDKEYNNETINPNYVVDNFTDIRNIIKVDQQSLF